VLGKKLLLLLFLIPNLVMGDEFGRSAGAGVGSGGSFFASLVLLIIIIIVVLHIINSYKVKMKSLKSNEAYKRNQVLADRIGFYILLSGLAIFLIMALSGEFGNFISGNN